MVFPQAVLEAVLPVAVLAADADAGVRVDVGLARWMRALRCCREGRFLAGWERRGGGRGLLGGAPCLGPLSGFGAGVRSFGPVVEAVGLFAGFAAEREEVELVAVGVVAVGTDGVKVLGLRKGHGGIRLGFWWWNGGRRGGCHDGELK